MLKKVVLPAPFGPISETIEASGIVKSTSFVAIRPPNSFRTLSARRRSVIAQLPIRVAAFERDVVQRRVADPELQLRPPPPLRDQALWSQEHHRHDDHAVDPELVLRRLEPVPAGLGLHLGADRCEPLDVEVAEQHPAQKNAPDRA